MREAAGLPKRKSKLTDTLKVDNLLIKGEAKIAECFNEHFSTITDKLRDTIPPTSVNPETQQHEGPKNFKLFTILQRKYARYFYPYLLNKNALQNQKSL